MTMQKNEKPLRTTKTNTEYSQPAGLSLDNMNGKHSAVWPKRLTLPSSSKKYESFNNGATAMMVLTDQAIPIKNITFFSVNLWKRNGNAMQIKRSKVITSNEKTDA